MNSQNEETSEHLMSLAAASWRQRVERIVEFRTKRGMKRVRVTYALVHATKRTKLKLVK